ncbi:MAG: hypothetical protein V2I34_04250 [Bacteroidales bacterium]|jgi:hypothetical protein|nr:hypothetical protein [Bacteroidales bacterium]
MNTFSRSLRTCLPGILILVSLQGYAQEIVKPNYGLKNPETIEVVRVRISADQTLVDMSIQNRVRGGYFCIDENTFIESAGGENLKLEKVSGLPLCPDMHEFSSVGEKVYFTLVFDKLPEDTPWFDIVEYCSDNCFSILALNMDEKINERINAAFSAMDRLDPVEAIRIFRDMLPGMQASGHGLTGSVYLNLVELLAANNRDDELQKLVSGFKASPMPHKERYLEILRAMGY